MKQRDVDNAMIVLKTLVRHHQSYQGEPLSALKVYETARDAGRGRWRSADLARTFMVSGERLVEVGLAAEEPGRTKHDRAFSPSPIGILVAFQHPEIFPRPAAPDRDQESAEATERWWRLILAVVAFGGATIAWLMSMAGASWADARWPLIFSLGAGLVVLLTPRNAFRLRR